jgi:hypothetical protein
VTVTKDDARAAEERAIFHEFVAAAQLPVVLESIESRLPPEPDILCEVAGGGRVAFELVRLVDQGLAHAEARAIKDPTNPEGVWFGDPTLERVREKLTEKQYKTPHPMELLAYGGDTLLPYEVWLPTHAENLRALFDSRPSRFRRLWVVNLGRLAASDPLWLVHPAPENR